MTCCGNCERKDACELTTMRKSASDEIEDMKAQLERNKRDILQTVIHNPELMRKLTAADLEKLDADNIKIPKSSIGKGKSLKELSAYEIDRMCD